MERRSGEKGSGGLSRECGGPTNEVQILPFYVTLGALPRFSGASVSLLIYMEQ